MSQPALCHEDAGANLALAARYAQVRAQTVALAAPLSEADCQVQSMPETSPVKWHLAHVSWFFETFVLERYRPGFKPFNPAFRVLFNSYYHGVGEQHPRAQRGLITRPGLPEVLAYRASVDAQMAELLQAPPRAERAALLGMVALGLQHEQQHQELLLTDVLHLLSCNPLAPVYCPQEPLPEQATQALAWLGFEGGLVHVGHGGTGFAFDNETPRHRQWLQPYALASRLVTHGEWAAFMADGGYTSPGWWSSAAWDWVRAHGMQAPLHWRRSGAAAARQDDWHCFTLHGLVPMHAATPVTHISWFEADAFARWWSAQHPGHAAARLPTEGEWEHAAEGHSAEALAAGNFLESGALHPVPLAELPAVCTSPATPAPGTAGPAQLLGDVWEWTASSYLPYPGFQAWAGTVGEYNAKFMVNQMVLRGGSCATPRSHIRSSYRNFFPTDTRWQFSGLRLACNTA